MNQVLQLLLAGVAQGCVYALVALGFVLIYKATETVNFAQGDLMMLGGFFALTASVIWGWPYWATILFAVAAMAAAGMLIERLVLRPVLGQPAFTVVMITIGIGFVLRGIVTMIPGWGTDTYTFPTPFADGTFKFGEVIFAVQQVAVIGMTATLPRSPTTSPTRNRGQSRKEDGALADDVRGAAGGDELARVVVQFHVRHGDTAALSHDARRGDEILAAAGAQVIDPQVDGAHVGKRSRRYGALRRDG